MRAVKDNEGGVHFPHGGGAQRAALVGSAVLADAVRAHDADLAQSIESSRLWRRSFPWSFHATTALSASAEPTRAGIAGDGLRAVRALLRYGSAGASLAAADLSAPGAEFETARIDGTGRPVAELQVPVDDELLSGDALLARLAHWRARGYVEPGFLSAISAVVEHPEWLALPGYRAVLLGAGADLGPYRSLVEWGADLLIIDQPGEDRWNDLLDAARAGAGTVTYPVRGETPGADLTRELSPLVAWLDTNTKRKAKLVLGSYARVDGPNSILVAAASDAITAELLERRPKAVPAYLSGPTDCYAVGPDVMYEARRRWRERGTSGTLADVMRVTSRSALFQPNYRDDLEDDNGHRWGVADAMIVAQGPNHALAQRLHRWRAIVATADGRRVSFNVAPPAWSRSAQRSPAVSAAFHGARRFGVRVFQPETARVLLAAKLVADLYRKRSGGAPEPEGLGYRDTLHGGLWRQPYSPASILNVVAVSGVPGMVADRLPFRG